MALNAFVPQSSRREQNTPREKDTREKAYHALTPRWEVIQAYILTLGCYSFMCMCVFVCMFFFYMCVSCPYFEKANQRSLDDKKKMCDPRHTVCLWYTQVFIFKVHWFIAWLLKYFHSWTTNYWIYKLKSSNEHSKITDFNSQWSLHFYNRSSLSCQFPLV